MHEESSLDTPTDLTPAATRDIAGALTILLADMFALYLKTKNFHWHVSGPHFRDYHLLLDEQGDQIFATTDAIAERVRKIGGTTLRSIGQIGRVQRVLDNDADYVTPLDMQAESRGRTTSSAPRKRARHAPPRRPARRGGAGPPGKQVREGAGGGRGSPAGRPGGSPGESGHSGARRGETARRSWRGVLGRWERETGGEIGFRPARGASPHPHEGGGGAYLFLGVAAIRTMPTDVFPKIRFRW